MADPFIAEIRIFAGNFPPRGWTFCNGQLLQIAQFTAVFSLIGTTYGGDGSSTMQLPNLQGRAPVHQGQGPGLARIRLGERSGATTHTLTTQQMPSHVHPVPATSDAATTGTPAAGTQLATAETPTYGPANDLDPMADAVGGSAAHPNEQPYLPLNFIFALEGVYPSRS